MSRLFFLRKPEYSDGRIDLIPIRVLPPDRALGFGRERVWRITEQGGRREIGRISYRDGESRGIYYYGHIGYHIDPPWRGHHYAAAACHLILEEIRMSGKSSVVITCDPDNEASRKVCLALGCMLEGETDVPLDLQERFDISARKCRYIWRVGEEKGDR